MDERKPVKVREEHPLRKGNAQKIIIKVEHTDYISLGGGYFMQSACWFLPCDCGRMKLSYLDCSCLNAPERVL